MQNKKELQVRDRLLTVLELVALGAAIYGGNVRFQDSPQSARTSDFGARSGRSLYAH